MNLDKMSEDAIKKPQKLTIDSDKYKMYLKM